MTITAERPTIAPGVYDMDEAVYHGDRHSLSASGAKKLLAPSCPALFKHAIDSGEQHKKTFDFGKVAHREVLGTGPDLWVVDAADWRTKKAQEQRDEAYAEGQVPILVADYAVVQAMAAALRAHPSVGSLFDPEWGEAEKSIFWTDDRTGITRRARLDWLRSADTVNGGRLIIPDYKTCRSASPAALDRVVNDYGYHMSADWYTDAVVAAELAEQAVMVFVFQEKTAPYLVTVVELSTLTLEIGRYRNRQAIDIYSRCVETGIWPGYSDGIELITLPPWVERAYFDEKESTS